MAQRYIKISKRQSILQENLYLCMEFSARAYEKEYFIANYIIGYAVYKLGADLLFCLVEEGPECL
jgi:hypothetical protein